MRAVLLPYPGDPFLLTYWLSFFDRYWGKEIDRLYIGLNSEVEDAVVSYIRKLCHRDNVVLDYVPIMNDHGNTINRLLDLVTEEHIMLAEDDAYIFRSGAVDRYFRLLETGTYDVIGSRRGSCSMEILTKARQLWGFSYEGEGDRGPNFWPCYFFCKTDLLKRSDRQFGAQQWKQGETIPALDNYTVREEVANGDTFVNTSLWIHSVIPDERIYYVPQYHTHPMDLRHFADRYEHSIFNGKAFWCHIGSLSSGISGVLTDGAGMPLSRRLRASGGPSVPDTALCSTEMEKFEWERRVQAWLTAWEKTPEDVRWSLGDFAYQYRDAIDRLIGIFGLSIKRIRQRQAAFAVLGL